MRRALDWLVVDEGGRTAGVLLPGCPVTPDWSSPGVVDAQQAALKQSITHAACNAADGGRVHDASECAGQKKAA